MLLSRVGNLGFELEDEGEKVVTVLAKIWKMNIQDRTSRATRESANHHVIPIQHVPFQSDSIPFH